MSTPSNDDAPAASRQLTRRQMLGLASAGTAGWRWGASAARWSCRGWSARAERQGGASAAAYPFFGAHQSGVTTPVQDHLHFAAFDMAADAGRDELVALLRGLVVRRVAHDPGPRRERVRRGRR